jgi:hypothetical protein
MQVAEIIDRADDSAVSQVGLEKPAGALAKPMSFSIKGNLGKIVCNVD